MATLYFASNASAGAGSLAEAIQNAQPGDVVRPDETVFERGSTIEIALASTLTVDKNLTLDGGPFRVRLNGGGAVRCALVAGGVSARFVGFDFVDGAAKNAPGGGVYGSSTTNATLERCGFYGCFGTYGGGAYLTGGSALNDCAVVGCAASVSGGGLYLSGASTLNGATVAGCVAANGTATVVANGVCAASNAILCGENGGLSSITATGCVVGVAPSSVGFVASPPDDLAIETWDANAWQNWNLRLLDDASPNPSPYRDAGSVDNMSRYDLQGNFRGRETNGAASCSPGAYETLQADLFWIGRDATGATVETPSFLSADGWATSRFATASGDAAPQIGQTVFVDGVVDFVDALSTSSSRTFDLIVGGDATTTIDAASQIQFGSLVISMKSTFKISSPFSARQKFRCGATSRVLGGPYLGARNEAVPQFDADVYLENASFADVDVSNSPIYGTLALNFSSGGASRLSGEYVCDKASFNWSRTDFRSTPPINDNASFRARAVSFSAAASPFYNVRLFNRPLRVVLHGVASFSMEPSAFKRWANDFIVDVSSASSASLTLDGQTIYGANPSCELELAGSSVVDRRGLTVSKIALNADATLTVAETELNVDELKLETGAALVLNNATVETPVLSTRNGSRIDGCGRFVFPRNAAWENDGATINGVSAKDYNASLNAVCLTFVFDAAEIRSSFQNGVYRWTSETLDAGTLPFIFGKHAYDAHGRGSYQTIYDSSQPNLDASAAVYETVENWDGVPLKTVVHATPEAGWNFYRVEVPAFATLGGAKIRHNSATTRHFVLWNADYEPEKTYYYRGDATGSYLRTSDWALTSDGVALFEGPPTTADAVFVVGRSAQLRDFPEDSLQTTVVFPSVVDVYNSEGRRLFDAEARLVSVGVPTPSAPEFYVGKGGTSGFWTQCDGATLYRVEAVDGSATGLTTSNRWLDANELETKTWRVRVAAPIYGGVEKWSSPTLAVQPFRALVEKPNYDDANAGTTFELLYADDFDGIRDATIQRAVKDDAASTTIALNFDGGEFTDVPETFGEYVYRVSWTPSPENVWLETTAAPWFVADGFDATSQTNFITTPNRAYETPTFAARIEKKSNGELLKRQGVAKIAYSLFKTRDFGTTRAERLAVGPDGSYWRRDVEIPAATVRDSLLVDPNFWSLDEIGANFVFSPDDGRPFFPRPGAYLVRTTLELQNGRRIVVEFPTQVE